MLKLSIITDEVSQDLDTAIAFAKRFGLAGVELRSVWERGPFAYTPEDVRAIQARVQDAGLTVCALSLPFYKCALDDAATRTEHLQHLRRALEHAQTLGASCLRGFSFWKEADEMPLARIADAYAPVIRLLDGTGVTLALEPDPSVYAGTATTLAALLAQIQSPCVQALWDGGNLLFHPAGESPLDGYALLRRHIAHVHWKDAIHTKDGAQAVRIGDGQADVRAQLQALRHDGYTGWASLETHYRLTHTLSDALMRLPSGGAFSEGGLPASTESMERLQAIIREVYAV